MIGLVATFDSDELANSLLEILHERELSPNRVSVTTSEDGEVGIIVRVNEADYEVIADLMREQGASRVEVDMTGREPSSSGSPALTDPEPPPQRASG